LGGLEAEQLDFAKLRSGSVCLSGSSGKKAGAESAPAFFAARGRDEG
jgi:hypothetical protein